MNRFLSASLLATVGLLTSCSDHDEKEPDYPIEPYIESADLKFVETTGLAFPDTLNLSFNFRDGDMDLGFNSEMRSDSDYPYHPINYFLENNGGLSMVTTTHIGFRPFLNVTTDQHGKLITVRTKKKDGYNFLPDYLPPFICTSFIFDSVYVLDLNKEIFDETYNLIESIDNPKGYTLLDTFYYELNQNHFNILVDYLVKQPDASFIKFDWHNEYCTTFDGRFPLLKGIKKGMTVVSGPFKIKGHSTKDGVFRFSMNSTGFKTLFGGKTIKLRVQIKDRALHDSNAIETNEIQL